MGLSAAAVCIEVRELLEQVCGTEMLPGLKLSNRLQQENFNPAPQEQTQMNSMPRVLMGREAHND